MQLPASMQELSDVIGREAALYLVGQLPACYAGRKGAEYNRAVLYVPKTLKPHHRLVEILGWATAKKLVDGFGGEILQPGNCQEGYRAWRAGEIRRLSVQGGLKTSQIAEMMQISERQIRNLTRWTGEMPNTANDNGV